MEVRRLKVATITSESAKQLLRFQENNGYLNDVRLESFGFFLDEYVIQGANLTFDSLNPRKLLLDEAIISLEDQLWRVFIQEYVMKRFNTTYYVGFVSEKGYVFGETEPSEKYMRLWSIDINANGDVTSVIDYRGVLNRVKFKARYDGVYLNTAEVEKAISDAISAAQAANDAAADVQDAVDAALQAANDANNAVQAVNNAVIRVGQALEDAEQAVDAAEIAVNNANTAVSNANAAIASANQATTDAQSATTEATTAAQAANNAAQSANQSATDATNAASNANTATVAANQAASAATTARDEAEQATMDAQSATSSAQSATNLANAATVNAVNAAQRAESAANEIEGWGQAVPYQNATIYNRNNVVTHSGNTYQAKQDGVTSIPPTNPIVDNSDWIVIALKGIDGTGAVDTVNGQTGNVVVDYDNLPNKPTAFPPSAHAHNMQDVTGLQVALDGKANDADLTLLEQTVTTHLDNDERHVTLQKQQSWDSKLNGAKSINGMDLNTITETGFYYGYNVINAAKPVISVFEVMRYSIDWIVQIQHTIEVNSAPQTYIRSKFNGTTWGAFTKTVLQEEIVWINGTLINGWAGTFRYARVGLFLIYEFNIYNNTPNQGMISSVPNGYQMGNITTLYDAASGEIGFQLCNSASIFITSGTYQPGVRYRGTFVGMGLSLS